MPPQQIQLIPLPEAVKHKLDLAAMPGAMSMPFLVGIPWAEIASALAALYAALRLLEFVVSRGIRLAMWLKSRRVGKPADQPVDK